MIWGDMLCISFYVFRTIGKYNNVNEQNYLVPSDNQMQLAGKPSSTNVPALNLH